MSSAYFPDGSGFYELTGDGYKKIGDLPRTIQGVEISSIIVDEREPLSREATEVIRKRIMAHTHKTPWFRFITDAQTLIERRAFRQHQQRLRKHGRAGRFDRRHT